MLEENIDGFMAPLIISYQMHPGDGLFIPNKKCVYIL